MKLLTSLRLIFALRCDEASQLASDAIDSETTTVERFALHLHVLVCRPCRRFLQQMRALRQLLRRIPDWMRHDTSAAATLRLSPERRQHIKHLLIEAQRLGSN